MCSCKNKCNVSTTNVNANINTYDRPNTQVHNAIECIVDSGCTKHYIRQDPQLQEQTTDDPLDVMLPNGDLMSSSKSTTLNIPYSSTEGKKAHIFDALSSGNLLSVGQLCDDGYKVTFTKDKVLFSKNAKEQFSGKRKLVNGMWTVQFPYKANIILPYKPLGDAIKFMHAACFSPCVSTWCQAIDAGYFSTWPGLTSKRVRQFIPQNTIPTVKGHLTQEKQHLRSTQIKANNAIETNNDAYVTIESARPTDLLNNKSYSDLTGRFPQRSNRGNQYIFILYDTNSNHIFAEPIKDRTSTHIEQAYKKISGKLKSVGIKPALHILDNEASSSYSKLIQNHGDTIIQFVPPNVHRRNIAERAIRTFKAHFIAGLCSTHKHFPLTLWDRLIPQAQMTLNMLRPSKRDPTISAYQQIYGKFDLNRTPIGPPGIKACIHLKANQRPTFGPRALECWYIGPSMNHYRCMTFYNPHGGERISDTAVLCPHNATRPQWTRMDAIIKATQDLTELLTTTAELSPYHALLREQQVALRRLADIFSLNKKPNIEPQPNSQKISPAHEQSRVQDDHQLPRVHPTPTLNPVEPTPTTRPQLRRPNQRLPTRANTNVNKKTIHMGNLMQEIYVKEKYAVTHTYNIPTNLCNAIIDPISGKSLEFRHLIKDPKTSAIWNKSFANELGRLANGVKDRIRGTNTIKFIPKSMVPKGRKVTYGRIVVDFRPNKSEPNRTRLTVGGDKIEYPGVVRTDTADIVTAKMLLNSVVSTPRARCCILDIKDFYLNNMLPRPEYMRIELRLIPHEIKQQYNLEAIAQDGYVYIQIGKGMYGLPQAGKIANDELKKHLLPFGYQPCPRTPGLWKHKTRPITFALVVDDFAVKYTRKEHLNHLLKALQSKYAITIDNDAKQFCGINLKWDYRKRTVTLSMPQYIQKLLHKIQHLKPDKPEHNPHKWEPPQFGKKAQYVAKPLNLPILPQDRIRRIQQILGSLLYYARAVDHTILMTVNNLASQQSKATSDTEQQIHKLLDYLATHPNATITYRRSKMNLMVHSDASYLSAPNARSRAGGYFFLSEHTSSNTNHPVNAPIHVECRIMKHVLSSATEAEIGAIFLNCQQAEILRTTLEELGHPQITTPIITDNATANNIINGNAKQRRTKAMDMRYNWILDRQVQKHFRVFWQPGKENLADYFTKHHSTVHHKRMRAIYVT